MINLGISNNYGYVYALEIEGKFYLELDDYIGSQKKEISEELYRLIETEFADSIE